MVRQPCPPLSGQCNHFSSAQCSENSYQVPQVNQEVQFCKLVITCGLTLSSHLPSGRAAGSQRGEPRRQRKWLPGEMSHRFMSKAPKQFSKAAALLGLETRGKEGIYDKYKFKVPTLEKKHQPDQKQKAEVHRRETRM